MTFSQISYKFEYKNQFTLMTLLKLFFSYEEFYPKQDIVEVLITLYKIAIEGIYGYLNLHF